MKKRLITLCTIFIIVILGACTGSQNRQFNGSMTGDEDHYDISFDILNTTYTHELTMKQGESILVHIEKQSGDIKVMIQKDQDDPVYEGNGDISTDFSINILEDGVYTVGVTGNKAKGHVTFNRVQQ